MLNSCSLYFQIVRFKFAKKSYFLESHNAKMLFPEILTPLKMQQFVERIFQFLWFGPSIFILNLNLTILKHKLREFSMLKRFCEDFIKFLRNRVEWKLVCENVCFYTLSILDKLHFKLI